jgi:hypothetical protein
MFASTATSRSWAGRNEGLGTLRARGEQLAHRGFGLAVHGRAVDHTPARREQRIEHAGQALEFGAAGRAVEADVGAAADDGKRLARRRDRAFMHVAHAVLLVWTNAS